MCQTVVAQGRHRPVTADMATGRREGGWASRSPLGPAGRQRTLCRREDSAEDHAALVEAWWNGGFEAVAMDRQSRTWKGT